MAKIVQTKATKSSKDIENNSNYDKNSSKESNRREENDDKSKNNTQNDRRNRLAREISYKKSVEVLDYDDDNNGHGNSLKVSDRRSRSNSIGTPLIRSRQNSISGYENDPEKCFNKVTSSSKMDCYIRKDKKSPSRLEESRNHSLILEDLNTIDQNQNYRQHKVSPVRVIHTQPQQGMKKSKSFYAGTNYEDSAAVKVKVVSQNMDKGNVIQINNPRSELNSKHKFLISPSNSYGELSPAGYNNVKIEVSPSKSEGYNSNNGSRFENNVYVKSNSYTGINGKLSDSPSQNSSGSFNKGNFSPFAFFFAFLIIS